jgi:hypothetical protein
MECSGVFAGIGLGCQCTAVSAQVQTPVPPKAAAAAKPTAKPTADPAYQDRVIEGLTAPVEDADVAALANYNPEGWTRQLRFETRIGQDSFNNTGCAQPFTEGGCSRMDQSGPGPAIAGLQRATRAAGRQRHWALPEPSGTVTSAGVQLDLAPWAFAARLAQAGGVALTEDPTLLGGPFDARSAQLAVRREIGDQSLQASLVSTASSALAQTQSGVCVDGETRDGPRAYSAGLFWLGPGLTWAGQPMASDAAGAYVRSTWQTANGRQKRGWTCCAQCPTRRTPAHF